MRIVIIGGHLTPALAVIDELPKDSRVLFIGRKYVFEGDKTLSLEYKTITQLGISFKEINTGRWQRKFTRYTIPSFLKIPYGFIQAFTILQSFNPDVMLTFGGYLSVPTGIVAYLLGIPLIIHEQTLGAGISSRILSFFAKKICISWETSKPYFPKYKTSLTGNPIRKEILNPPSKFSIFNFQFSFKDENLPIIYITGGSSGSHFINTLVESCIEELLKKFIIIHQTGDAQEYHDFDRLTETAHSLPSILKTRYILTKFIKPQDIGSVLQKADMVVGRAGINTVNELIYFNKPAILIPISFGQNKEQLNNALFFKSLGLGEALAQESLSSPIFLQKIRDMINNINKYKNRNKFDVSINKNAAQNIVKIIEYVKKSKEV